MILSPRKIAGYTLTAAAFALAAMSGMVSFTGISTLLPSIPGIGFLGFVIAVTTVALGIAVIAELVDGRWKSVLAYGGLLVLVACSDGYTNMLALQGQVSKAEQATADRNQSFDAASETLALARAEIAATHRLIALMNADAVDEIREAQTYLASKGLYLGAIDGIRGGQTLAAMRAEGGKLSARLEMLQAREDELIPVVSAGADVVAAPFSMADAQLYGVLITVFGITLSFAGSALVNTGQSMEAREVEVNEREEAMAFIEDELQDDIVEDQQYLTLLQMMADEAKQDETLVDRETDRMPHLPPRPNFSLTVEGEAYVEAELARRRKGADDVVHGHRRGDKVRAA